MREKNFEKFVSSDFCLLDNKSLTHILLLFVLQVVRLLLFSRQGMKISFGFGLRQYFHRATFRCLTTIASALVPLSVTWKVLRNSLVRSRTKYLRKRLEA